jgi:uncharacterized protein (DUF302 family)
MISMPDAGEVVTKISPWSFDDTVARLVAMIKASGYDLLFVIDHRAEAAGMGIEVPLSKLAIFGNPVVVAPVIAAAPLAALDLPLKVLIWANRGSTLVSYTAPAVIADRYQLSPELSDGLARVESLTDAVIAI